VHRDVLELQYPARKRLRLKDGQFLNDDRGERGNDWQRSGDERRVDPERRFILMIERVIEMIGVVLDVSGMMRLEMTMNNFGVFAAFGLADVNVLGRQQRQAEKAEHSSDGERAPERHCGDYQWRRITPSILSGV
jgi:hypothetical protein